MSTTQKLKTQYDGLLKQIKDLTAECDAIRKPGVEGTPLSTDEMRSFNTKADTLLNLKKQRDLLASEISDAEQAEAQERGDESRRRGGGDETRRRQDDSSQVRRGGQPGRGAEGTRRDGEDEQRNIFMLSPLRLTDEERARRREMCQDMAMLFANSGEAAVLKYASKYEEVRSAMDAGVIRTKLELTMDHDEQRGVTDEQRDEFRNQLSSPGASGGFLVPANPLGDLVAAKRAFFGPIEAGCSVIYTPNGSDIPYPVMDDTANRAVIRMEGTAPPNTTIAFAQRLIKTFMYGSGGLPWSKEWARDASISEQMFNQIILQPLTERFSRAAAIDMTVGNGVNEPEGLLTAIDAVGANAYVNAAVNNAITADDLYNLQQGVDISYRDNGVYLASDVDRGRLGLLKDGSGKYYFLRNDGQRQVMDAHGYPLRVATSLPTTAYGANQTRILFGDLRFFLARIVQGVSFFRSEHNLASTNQHIIYGFAQMGSRYINPAGSAATQPIKGLRMPA